MVNLGNITFVFLKNEYSGVAEPPVRFMVSHPSGLAEPVFRKSSQSLMDYFL